MDNSWAREPVFPPRKTARIEQDLRGSALYFGVLPEELLDNFLRFFSTLPKAVNWENHLPISDIYRCMALAVAGEPL